MKLLVAIVVALTCVASHGAAQEPESRRVPWSDGIVELAESLPVQDGGRVKPLHTFASFTLLRLNGKRSLTTPSGERLGPTEWLLDILVFPQTAIGYRQFLVQNDEVIAAIGLSVDERKKRDRYTFEELRPGVGRLFELARQYTLIEEADRSSVQQQVVHLANNVDEFMRLAGHLDFARMRLRVGAEPEVAELFDASVVPFHAVVRAAPGLHELADGVAGRGEALAILRAAADVGGASGSLALLPPVAPVDDEPSWLTPDDVFYRSYDEGRLADEHAEALRSFVALVDARLDPGAFERELAGLHARLTGLAEARGEYASVGLEVAYYKAKLLSWSLYLFVFAFLGLAFLWLRPRAKVLYAGISGVAGIATLLLIAAIVVRCVIRGRPPVSTLYETVLFVTCVGAIVGLAVEAVNRRRLALSAAAIFGMIGLFIANGYELLDKQDTMPSLVAVLDTNFWLATHVTSITIGYSAGMFAALLGSLYLLAKLARFKRDDRAFYKGLARMVYGVLCFGLLFSLIGTILGGIWANDSWGRFWGWDPKENGALLICIVQIAILHARMGGFLRDHGVCAAAAFGGTVVAFSWWGVNLLGVGLHSYGFTSGIHDALWTYYLVQWAIVGLGGVAWLLERRNAAADRLRAVPGRPPEEIAESKAA